MQKSEREQHEEEEEEVDIEDEIKWWIWRALVRLVLEGVFWLKHAPEFCRFQQSQPIQEDVVASFESKFKTKKKNSKIVAYIPTDPGSVLSLPHFRHFITTEFFFQQRQCLKSACKFYFVSATLSLLRTKQFCHENLLHFSFQLI